MPCGCSGSGGWQAEGYEPAPPDITNPDNFWTGEPAATSDQAETARGAGGAAHWSAKTGTTITPEA
jgi:hypothetical protein